MLATTKRSSNWSARSAPSGDDLDAVTCVARRCVVAGSDGTVASSSNSGRSWALKGTGTIAALRSLSCPATGGCYVAGDNGAILNVSA